MAEILTLVESQQGWIYLALGVAALIYVRGLYKGLEQLRGSRFGLEQEQARSSARRASAMLILVLLAGVAIFITANFIGPAVPFAARPTAIPTVSLLSTSQPAETGQEEEFVAATAIPGGTPDGSGCTNLNATFTTPENGATLTGVVEIEGTADISNFAFYKFEFRPAGSNQDVWQAISAGTDTVQSDVLGNWDTSLVPAGDYDFRLVVTDTSGNAPFPCEIQVRVVPPE